MHNPNGLCCHAKKSNNRRVFINNFTFYSPTYFVFGKGEENNAGKYVKRFGGSRVLIHYGGSTVDSARGIALGALYDGDFWDFYSGKKVEKALPVATVLTIAAAGSEGSSGSVVTKEEGMLKRSSGHPGTGVPTGIALRTI